MKLEEKLVSLRKEKGLSQLKLAEQMNVSRQAISRWEVGAATPSIENLKYLGRLYDVPLEYLLHDDAPDPANRQSDSRENDNNAAKKRPRKIVLAFIIIAVLIVIIVGAILLNSNEKHVQMDDMEGSEMVTGKDFQVNW